MKRLIAIAITLLIGLGVWIVGVSQTSQRGVSTQTNQSAPNVTAQTKGIGRFEVYDWGTLKSLWDSTGKQIYGPEKSANEGYSIVYQVLGGKSEKQLQGVFAIGKTFSSKQLASRETASKKVKLGNIEVTCVTVTTADNVLRIDSNYYIDPQTKALNVIRLINNISKRDVRLVAVRTLHDSGLRPTGPTRFGDVNPKVIKTVDLGKVGYAQSTAILPNNFAFGLLSAAAFPEFPCTLCPPDCYSNLSVNPGEVKGYCVECTADGKPERDVLTEAGCMAGKTVVKIEGWDRLPASIVGKERWGSICVTCNGTSVEQVVLPGAGGGVPNPTVEEYRKDEKCKFQIDFDRGPKPSPDDIKPGRTVANGQSFTTP